MIVLSLWPLPPKSSLPNIIYISYVAKSYFWNLNKLFDLILGGLGLNNYERFCKVLYPLDRVAPNFVNIVQNIFSEIYGKMSYSLLGVVMVIMLSDWYGVCYSSIE